jgi:hypothetical protein
MQAQTKMKLGATAGLRLLPEGKADVILDEVCKFLKTYPFQLDNKTGVTILDGASPKHQTLQMMLPRPALINAADACDLHCPPVQSFGSPQCA